MTIDLDKIYKDGKLFGYDIYFKKVIDYNGEEIETGPWVSIKDGNKSYEVQFFWDWIFCCLRIVGKTEISTSSGKIPLTAQRQISFDMLFRAKPEITKVIVEDAIDELIIYFKSKEGKQ